MGTDNSAVRLTAILERVRDENATDPALRAWMRVFDVPDYLGVLQGAADLGRLVDQLEADVLALPKDEDPEHLLSYLPLLRKLIETFAIVGKVSMVEFAKHAHVGVIYSVASCARALRRNGRIEPLIADDSVKQLVNDVRAIIDDVIVSDLPESLKELLVDRLRDVEVSLLNVRIGGYASVEKAMDSLTFAAMRATEPDSGERAQAGSFVARLWGKLSEHAQGAEAIASTAASTAEVVKAITGS
ncbi:hypothetical protein ACLQ2S_19220 [Micromonospora sp. DT48]|uniref:hypothetical protein n=1 Tax=Micromonospora sp. DT48 TaxID=3393429 RepID=UPI003CE8D8A7